MRKGLVNIIASEFLKMGMSDNERCALEYFQSLYGFEIARDIVTSGNYVKIGGTYFTNLVIAE